MKQVMIAISSFFLAAPVWAIDPLQALKQDAKQEPIFCSAGSCYRLANNAILVPKSDGLSGVANLGELGVKVMPSGASRSMDSTAVAMDENSGRPVIVTRMVHVFAGSRELGELWANESKGKVYAHSNTLGMTSVLFSTPQEAVTAVHNNKNKEIQAEVEVIRDIPKAN
ncbi:hypothetical protein [Chromobacterium sp. Panama]|uniref:hypothetical protein n=1 Tax=Chromobacterium sp. Panama TaxID=2161826 RepID=UPI0011B249CB|nr:hypothetical protein [Chromobacterium sp. Panama]